MADKETMIVNCSMPKELHEAVREYCEREDITLSQLIRKLLRVEMARDAERQRDAALHAAWYVQTGTSPTNSSAT